MIDLVDFLLARLSEDQELAQSVANGPWAADVSDYADPSVSSGSGWIAECLTPEAARHIAHYSGSRMVTEAQAKRRIVARHGLDAGDSECQKCFWTDGECITLRLLALPYANHPDYQQRWHA